MLSSRFMLLCSSSSRKTRHAPFSSRMAPFSSCLDFLFTACMEEWRYRTRWRSQWIAILRERYKERERDFKLTFRLTIKEHEKKTNGHDMRRKGQGRTRAIIISQNSKCLHFLFYFTSLVTTRQCLIATHARLLVPFLRQCICAAFFGRWGSLLGRRDWLG